MANVLKTYQIGKIRATALTTEYKGEPGVGFTVSKSRKKEDGTWEDVPFRGVQDLKDTIIACQLLLADHYQGKLTTEPDPFA